VTSDSTTLRSRFGRVLVIVVWAILIAFIVGLIVEQNANWLLRYTPIIVLSGYVVWLLMWSPSVTIAPSGVTVRNLLRTNEISWPAIQTIDTRFALTLQTTAGRIVAWSAPAPSRFAALRATRTELSGLPESSFAMGGIRPGDIPQTDSGLAALYVRRYWEQLRDAGYLDTGVIEGTGVTTRWLVREAAVFIGLVVISAGALALIPNPTV
jgi:PH (Pleckstrin Homology) domain-containing protein